MDYLIRLKELMDKKKSVEYELETIKREIYKIKKILGINFIIEEVSSENRQHNKVL